MRSDGLAKCSSGINDDRLLAVERTPSGYCIVLDIQVFEAALNHLFEGVLTTLQVQQFRISRPPDAFEENCSSVCLKTTGRKRALIRNAFFRVFQAVTDGLEADAGFKEALDKSKFD